MVNKPTAEWPGPQVSPAAGAASSSQTQDTIGMDLYKSLIIKELSSPRSLTTRAAVVLLLVFAALLAVPTQAHAQTECTGAIE